jgi:hypothetical protein
MINDFYANYDMCIILIPTMFTEDISILREFLVRLTRKCIKTHNAVLK